MDSILSFKERGHWGDSAWRGNTSGHIYRELIEQYRPAVFVDPMVGSGTAIDVCKEMSVECYGLDLHSGFNILRDSILEKVGKEADMVFSHSPYHDMVIYSGEVWGTAPHPDDLSRCASDDDFCEKLHVALLNQRHATKAGGMYGLLIGDLRRNGRYSSYQAEMISRMPKNELASVVIKAQHNCMSDSKRYSRMRHAKIVHEYILLWTRLDAPLSMLMDLSNFVREHVARGRSLWRVVVQNAMLNLGGQAKLADLYAAIESQAPDNLKENAHWRAKVRQTLQLSAAFKSVNKGVWALA